jgi:KDO2-lipid IV(A) lauroyltransferase
MDNLQRSLGNTYSQKELRRIALKAYQNIGITFIETLIVPKLAGRVRGMVDMSGAHILKRNFDKERGVMLIASHFGSWEFNGAGLFNLGLPLITVAKKLSNPYTDRFARENRVRLGMRVVNKGVAVKNIVRTLKNHEIVGLISDQDAGRGGVFVDFFGRKASTPRGGAELALKYGAPIIVIMTVRTGDGFYKSLFREVEYDTHDTVETLTQRYTKVMEDIIREYPEQYFWMHRRWKTPPPQ